MDLLFIIKKLVAGWSSPLPLSLLLIGMGLYCLLRQRQRRALLLIGSGWLTLLLLSIPPLADWWLAPREAAITINAPTNQPVAAIVVLGCGFEVIANAPASSWLSRCAARRVMQGFIEWQRQPQALMVFTGGTGEWPSVAEAMAAVALELGVPANRVKTITNAPDTSAEAAAVADLIDGPVLLVTSASHMPRALNYFQMAGVKALPKAADHLAAPDFERSWYSYAPKAEQLTKAERAWYETLGLLWQRLGGS